MKRPAAIVLLFLSLSTTEFAQVLKLPWLISHFIDHHRRGQRFYDFMHEHYVHHHGTNGDEKEDQQLPFKTSTIQETTFAFVLPPAIMVKDPARAISENKFLLPVNVISFDYLKDIFHPPQLVYL